MTVNLTHLTHTKKQQQLNWKIINKKSYLEISEILIK